MIVTVSGFHGAGKSTYAGWLAQGLNLRHVSAGLMFRRLAKERHMSLEELGQLALRDPSIDRLVDDETMSEAEKGDVVVDGQLAGWVLREVADLRVCLTAPEMVRLERIAKRDGLSLEDARKVTFQRENVQSERYRKHYGFKVDDRSIYHMVFDTSLLSMEDTAKILLSVSLALRSKLGIPARKP